MSDIQDLLPILQWLAGKHTNFSPSLDIQLNPNGVKSSLYLVLFSAFDDISYAAELHANIFDNLYLLDTVGFDLGTIANRVI